LPKRYDEISFSLSNKFIDLIAFNKTRLDSSISDNQMYIDGYDIIRKDRSRSGGGVCMYLRSSDPLIIGLGMITVNRGMM
jgi:hypothetical protein